MSNAEPESYQLPPGKGHTWVVIVRGVVEPETVTADTWYKARERACARHQCSSSQIKIGLLPKELCLLNCSALDGYGEPKNIKKKRATRSKKK